MTTDTSTRQQPSRAALGLGALLLTFAAQGQAAGGDLSAPAAEEVPGIHARPATAPKPAMTGDRATNAFNWMNYRRAQLGLAALARDPALDRAAAAHLAYLVANPGRVAARHDETPGKPGYTGATPGARAAAAGYDRDPTGENLGYSMAADGTDAIESLIDAPYHRQQQLGNFAAAGIAIGSGMPSLCAIEFGGVASASGLRPGELVVYPAAGETAAPIDWVADEIPNPLPDLAGRRVGYPVSIGSVGALTIASFAIEDSRGAPLEARLITRRTDDGRPMRNHAFVVPLAPFAPGSVYTASATGTAGGQPFAVRWSFTTAPATALTITSSRNALAAAPGSTVDVTVSGGTGRHLAVGVVGYSYLSDLPVTVAVDALVSIEAATRASLRLTRGATACNGRLSNCQLRLRGQDSAGNLITTTLPIE